KAELQIADMDRHYYRNHALTLARHPSENDERMMIRLLAFALNASDAMSFSKGLSTEDEPELWQKNLSDEIEIWIDLGQPDEKRIRKACGRAEKVLVYAYNHRSVVAWWEQVKNRFARFDNLSIILIPDEAVQAMGGMAQRGMQLQYTIQDGEVLLSNGETSTTIAPETLTSD
ncbi:MAG: YaeQ family protein, partial [Mariprofundaceae bacterium]|nr:YaeQ family protein [Mariprofundaceae bacterium]